MNGENNSSKPTGSGVRHHGVLRNAAANGFGGRTNNVMLPSGGAMKDTLEAANQGNGIGGVGVKKFRDVGKEMLAADRNIKDDPFQRAANQGQGAATNES